MIDSPHTACRHHSRIPAALRAFLLLLIGLIVCGPRLSGQALNPGGPVDFGSYPVNSGSNTLTLVFNASTTTVISAVTATTAGSASSDFQVAYQNCTGVQAPPSSCIITLTFSPTSIGLRRGALMIQDGSGSIVNLVFLHGIGLAPQMILAPAQTTQVDVGVPGLSPTSAATDGNNNLFFTDLVSNTVYERTPAGVNTTAASLPLTVASSLAVSGQGYVYVSTPGGAQVLVIHPAGGLPQPLNTGSVTLVRPTGLAVDGLGYLYIADAATNSIVRVALDGSGSVVLTLSGLSTPLFQPAGLTVDSANNLYIADTGNNRIVKLGLLTGKASTVPLGSLTLSSPAGVTVDPAGSLTVADTGNARLVVIPASGAPFVLATPGAALSSPVALLTQPNGDLLLSDTIAGMLLVSRSTLSLTFPTPTKVGTTDTADGTISATFQNSGNLALQISAPGSGINPNISTGAFALSSGDSTCPIVTAGSTPTAADGLALGALCTYASTFSPTNTGINTAQLNLTAVATLGGAAVSQTVTLIGTGFSTLDHFIVVAMPSVTTPGAPVTISVTAITNTGAVATDYLGTITFSATDATAIFPAGFTYTFTAGDAGTHTFAPPAGVQFNTLGTFTVSVADNKIVGTSNPVQVINPPTVALSSSVNPVFIGGSTVLSVSVTAAAGSPGGTVTFFNGSTALGTVTLVGGTASLSVPFNTAGTYSLTASYSGDSNFAPTVSNTILESVQNATPIVTLASSANPVLVGGSTTLSVSVASTAGTPTGTVTFFNGSAPLGTATLVNGATTLSVPFNTPGTFTLTASYGGDTTFVATPSNTILETVQNPVATVALSSSANPILVGGSTTLSVIVSSTSGKPTGTVTFLDGSTPLATVALVNGAASLPATFTLTGGHNLTVTYSGDATFAAGPSNTVVEVVEDFTIALAPGASGTLSTNPGSPASFALLVSPIGGSTFAAPVTYTVSGTPNAATVAFTPASIAAGVGPTFLGLTITPAANHVARLEEQSRPRPGSRSFAPVALAVLFAPLAFFRRRSRFVVTACLLFVTAAASLGLTGCLSDSSSGYYSPEPHTYPLTITATSGPLTHTVSVSLTVE